MPSRVVRFVLLFLAFVAVNIVYLTVPAYVLAAIIVFVGPYTWLIASAVSTSMYLRKTISKISAWYGSVDYRFTFLVVMVTYQFAFEYLLYLLPQFVTETFVRDTAGVFLTVEGFILPLTSQLKITRLRHQAVTLTIVGVIIGTITVTLANFQSLQLKFSSTDVVTLLFKLDGAIFSVIVLFFGFSILYTERIREQDEERVRKRLVETEP